MASIIGFIANVLAFDNAIVRDLFPFPVTKKERVLFE